MHALVRAHCRPGDAAQLGWRRRSCQIHDQCRQDFYLGREAEGLCLLVVAERVHAHPSALIKSVTVVAPWNASAQALCGSDVQTLPIPHHIDRIASGEASEMIIAFLAAAV